MSIPNISWLSSLHVPTKGDKVFQISLLWTRSLGPRLCLLLKENDKKVPWKGELGIAGDQGGSGLSQADV